MSRFNVENNRQIIPNANQYLIEKKYVSIHSEDRNITKFPNSSEFEIELPEDLLNVLSVKLSTWALPANYDTFSFLSNNIGMTFKFMNLYNPAEHGVVDPLQNAIFAGLYANINKEYVVIIESGFYNPFQMAIELTNKFNQIVSNTLYDFYTNNPAYNYALALDPSYNRFQIVYNSVSQKIWFGNKADQFILTNETNVQFESQIAQSYCTRKNVLPSYANWGLPSFLGFTRCNTESFSYDETSISVNKAYYNGNYVPRFFYGDILAQGDNGFWLLPELPGAIVYFCHAPSKINLMGQSYIYMEIAGLNCIDETSPFNISTFTIQTNQTNGIVNSSFAKIPVVGTPVEQYFDGNMLPYKWFNPPAERIRKLKIKLRYHDGQLVEFGSFDYTFMLEFSLLNPQSQKSLNIRSASEYAQYVS